MLHVIIPACNLIPKPRNSNHRCFTASVITPSSNAEHAQSDCFVADDVALGAILERSYTSLFDNFYQLSRPKRSG